MNLKKTFLKWGGIALKLFIAFNLIYIGFIAVFSIYLRFFNPPVTSLMMYRQFAQGRMSAPLDWVPLSQIPKPMQNMVLRLEDGKFYTHFGFDLEAIRTAWKRNQKAGKKLFGGSTLTQQLARTLFLNPKKRFVRKYLELIAAVELEIFLPKDRILELYLNSIEWGKGFYGIGNAAKRYYGKIPASLTREEMRLLAVIISNPIRFRPDNALHSRGMRERYSFLEEFNPVALTNFNNSEKEPFVKTDGEKDPSSAEETPGEEVLTNDLL